MMYNLCNLSCGGATDRYNVYYVDALHYRRYLLTLSYDRRVGKRLRRTPLLRKMCWWRSARLVATGREWKILLFCRRRQRSSNPTRDGPFARSSSLFSASSSSSMSSRSVTTSESATSLFVSSRSSIDGETPQGRRSDTSNVPSLCCGYQ